MTNAALVISEWEKSALRFVAEQGVVTSGQLARFLGVYRADAEGWLLDAAEERWLAVESHQGDVERWVRLKEAGQRAAGVESSRAVPRSRKYLESCRAATDVRLEVEAQLPDARWVSRRAEQRRRRRRGRGPAGVVEVGGERHCVELVEGTAVRRSVLERVRRRLSEYDAVLLWCSAAALPALDADRLGSSSRVLVRELPGPEETPVRRPRRRRGAVARGSFGDAELHELLGLLADQRALTEGQVERLLKAPPEAVAALLGEAERAGLVRRGRPVWEMSRWVWLSGEGVVAVGEAPGPQTGMLVDVEACRALTEARLNVEAAGGRWVARRRLRVAPGGRWIDALAVSGSTEAAVCVEVDPRGEAELVERYAPIVAAHDAVWCYCSQGVAGRLEVLAAQEGWRGLEVRPVPGEPAPRPRRRAGRARGFTAVEVDEVPEVAVAALETASGHGRQSFASPSRRTGPGARAYRVEVAGKSWRVARSPAGWSARMEER